jgi:hypothetical protein
MVSALRSLAVRSLFAALLLGLLPLTGAAQELTPEKAEWGDVSREHLELDAHPSDSNATAIILSDVGETRFRRNGELRFERTRRIKLLTESAYDEYGTVKLSYVHDDMMQRVKNVDGHTFILNDDGEVERFELDGDDVYEEEVDDTHGRVTFTLPNLKPGAIIEYRYEIRSKNPIFLNAWNFQHGEPTLYSEYVAEAPENLDYAVIAKSSPQFDTKETHSVNTHVGPGVEYVWIATEVPALRAEPFMTTLEDHRASVQFQLRGIRNPNTNRYQPILTSWTEVAEGLMGSLEFGRNLTRHQYVRRYTEKVIGDAGADTDEEKIEAIYDFVAARMSWTKEDERFVIDRQLDDVLKEQSGTTAEINMLLCSMLMHADIDARPVLISTRDHGQVMPLYPFLSQFNALVVGIPGADETTFLDATDPNRPAGLLPTRALNGQGWMVHESEPTWIPIPPTGADQRTSLVSATLSADGTLSGSVNVSDQSYRALDGRHALDESDADAFVADDVFEGRDAEISEAEVENLDAIDKPLKTKASFEMPAYAQVAGDFLYVNPVLIGRQSENVLKSPTRQFPVNYGYPRMETYTLTLQIPEGYEVKEAPKNTRVRLGEKQGDFIRMTQASGDRVMMRMTFMIRQPVFAAEQYDMLRNFYKEIVSAHAQPLVLQRKTPEASDASAATEGE